MIYIRRVIGVSMMPKLRPNNIVVAYKYKKIKPRNIVIAKINSKEVIKRVEKINKKGKIYLVGDNLNCSTDSRTWGWIDKSKVIGVVVLVL